MQIKPEQLSGVGQVNGLAALNGSGRLTLGEFPPFGFNQSATSGVPLTIATLTPSSMSTSAARLLVWINASDGADTAGALFGLDIVMSNQGGIFSYCTFQNAGPSRATNAVKTIGTSISNNNGGGTTGNPGPNTNQVQMAVFASWALFINVQVLLILGDTQVSVP